MKLTNTDRMILNSYFLVLDGLAAYLGSGFEFVLHTLETYEESAIKVVNGFHSNRSEGAPITDLALKMLNEMNDEHRFMCYMNQNASGETLKSATIPIVGEGNKTIGLLCINFYLSSPIMSILNGMIHVKEENGSINKISTTETFTRHVDDLIMNSLEEAKNKIYNNMDIPSTNKNKEIILDLHKKGVFNLKDAVLKVSQALGISKNTVYLHLRKFNLQKSK